MSEQGIVKWYSLARGYGFIRRDGVDDDAEDVFVHHSEVVDAPLTEGERVSFESRRWPQRPQGKQHPTGRRESDAEIDRAVRVSRPSRRIVGVALAGGESRRMGRDKARLRLGGASLTESAVARLQDVVTEVLIADRGVELVSGYRSVPDGPGAGPAAGILGAAAERPDADLLVLGLRPARSAGGAATPSGRSDRRGRSHSPMEPRDGTAVRPLPPGGAHRHGG